MIKSKTATKIMRWLVLKAPSSEYIDKINALLANSGKSNVYILNDKLTLSVFSILEKNLKNVNRIFFILRSNVHLPQQSISREFEINPTEKDDDFNPSDALFNEYEIVEKNELTHFAKAKAMHDFIKKNVEIKRLKPGIKLGINILIIDEEYMISGTNSLELGNSNIERSINFTSTVNELMDKSQIVAAKREFERIWYSDQFAFDYKEELLKSLRYVYKEHSPEFAYYFLLNEFFGDKIDDSVRRFENENKDFKQSKIWNMLFDFQKEAVLYAIQKINKYNGCIIADSVGLGKTFEALAVMKYYSDRQDNILVLTPAKLYNNWDSYRDNDYADNPLIEDNIRYKVLCHTDLSRYFGTSRSSIDLARFDWSRFDLIVIDESHNFRNRLEKEDGETRYQRLLETVIKKRNRTKVLMLSATPVNNGLTDLKNQISLITADNDEAFEKFGIKSIANTLRNASTVFNSFEKQNPRFLKDSIYNSLPKSFFDLLELVTISRSRKHITTYYKGSGVGKFPTKLPVTTYNPLIDSNSELLKFDDTLKVLEDLTLCLYTPMKYIKSQYKQLYEDKFKTVLMGKAVYVQDARENMLKAMQLFNLFKRLESSVFAFDKSLERLDNRIGIFIDTLEKSEKLETGELDSFEGDEELSLDYKLDIKANHLQKEEYLRDLYLDKAVIAKLREDTAKILNGNRDSKLAQLKEIVYNKIKNTPYNQGNKKVLIFTAFADTARYLYNNLFGELSNDGYHTAMVSGSEAPLTTLKFKGKVDFNSVLKHFSPKSKGVDIAPNNQITVLIGTDCISEGQNLQDCDVVLNYDIQWNPVTLIQRFGRIDRIGSQNNQIKLINFFPSMDLNSYLGLETRVKKKMAQANIASSGDENLLNPELNDLRFRTSQMKKLQSEVIDLDEASDSISITDLNMNQYLYELSGYIKKHPEIKLVPRGIYSITQKKSMSGNNMKMLPHVMGKLASDSKTEGAAHAVSGDGVLFCFKHKNNEEKPVSESSLYPYYLAFISFSGEIILAPSEARELLKRCRGLCLGCDKVNNELISEFLKETNNTQDMRVYSDLLNKVIDSINKKEEENAAFSLFNFGGFKNVFAEKSSDAFELVAFIIVKANIKVDDEATTNKMLPQSLAVGGGVER